ncbi:MAG TPA: DinB family protein [Thermomicrobiales bacterium]|nr:DinB family protein [Thermomicrobiales bacterium]
MRTGSEYVDVDAPVSAEQLEAIRSLDNNALIIRLHFTINHLSRWLSPIHEPAPLIRSRYRGEPTVKDLLLAMRDYEQYVYPKMYVIASQETPDLDTIPDYRPSAARQVSDAEHSPIVLMSNFRRLRQSTCSLLRNLPDEAWDRKGFSRVHRNATIRQLAEGLAEHDYRHLRAIDQLLTETGAREGLAEIQKAPLDELIKLVPQSMKG